MITRLPGAVMICFTFNCYWLLLRSSSFSKKNWSLVNSILNFFQVVFHFQKNLRLSSIFKSFEVIFHFQIFWGRLPFTKFLKSSSIFNFLDLVFYFKHFLGCFPFLIFLEVILHFQIFWGCLPIFIKFGQNKVA